MGRRAQPNRRRGSAREGFNVTGDRRYEVYADRGGEPRKLRYTLYPDVVGAGRLRPELLELIYRREVTQWVEKMEADGYTLATKPSPPQYRISPNPMDPKGTRWGVVEARFAHFGPVAVLKQDDIDDFKAHGESIGAEKSTTKAGVGDYLASLPVEEAERLVQQQRPRES